MQPTPVVTEAMQQVLAHHTNPGGAIRRALQMKQDGTFTEWADALAIMGSWDDKRVIVDGAVWIPPLVEE